jgi:HAD superfamily hydrolase (TIGR01509 family)
MDGTLVDSEEYHWNAWRETMAAEGITITREQFLATFGQRNDSILPHWLGPDATPERIQRVGDVKEKLYRDMVRRYGLAPLPGAADWVRRLRAEGWLQAVASAAPRRNLETVMDVIGLSGEFQATVSAEDVARGKPDPDVFLTAARRLSAAPSQCVVVEDAAAGVEAARRAGMRSIGVSGSGKPLDADVTVRSLTGLAPNAFDRLLES